MRYAGIKGKAWDEVKKWCRRTYKHCYTCSAKNLQGQNAQAGHCWPVGLVGSNNTFSWDERQIRLQCGRCNGVGQGMQAIFKAKLALEYGLQEVENMQKWVDSKKVSPIKDWNQIIEHFKNI